MRVYRNSKSSFFQRDSLYRQSLYIPSVSDLLAQFTPKNEKRTPPRMEHILFAGFVCGLSSSTLSSDGDFDVCGPLLKFLWIISEEASRHKNPNGEICKNVLAGDQDGGGWQRHWQWGGIKWLPDARNNKALIDRKVDIHTHSNTHTKGLRGGGRNQKAGEIPAHRCTQIGGGVERRQSLGRSTERGQDMWADGLSPRSGFYWFLVLTKGFTMEGYGQGQRQGQRQWQRPRRRSLGFFGFTLQLHLRAGDALWLLVHIN